VPLSFRSSVDDFTTSMLLAIVPGLFRFFPLKPGERIVEHVDVRTGTEITFKVFRTRRKVPPWPARSPSSFFLSSLFRPPSPLFFPSLTQPASNTRVKESSFPGLSSQSASENEPSPPCHRRIDVAAHFFLFLPPRGL